MVGRDTAVRSHAKCVRADSHDGVVMWTGAEILDWYKAQVGND
jgi:hypothetical protein